jgi:4a-hydroxytetrahydrobiopterin dehydratase
MAAHDLLTDDEISTALDELAGWRHDGDRLVGEWRFGDFAAAFGFMAQIALHAERLDHHPEWTNVYNRVSIALSTHSSGGVTGLDVELAGVISQAAERAGGSSAS